VRLLIDRLATAVEEGCANRREQNAAVGSAEKQGDVPMGDEPRPTRSQRAHDLRPRRSAPAAASAASTPAATTEESAS
jgi:hypothetical protein